MSDPALPRLSALPAFAPTDPARGRELEPNAGDLVLEIGELKSMLDDMAAKITSLTTSLSRYQLRLLAHEHKAGTAIDLAHEAFVRLGKIEAHLGMAAE